MRSWISESGHLFRKAKMRSQLKWFEENFRFSSFYDSQIKKNIFSKLNECRINK